MTCIIMDEKAKELKNKNVWLQQTTRVTKNHRIPFYITIALSRSAFISLIIYSAKMSCQKSSIHKYTQPIYSAVSQFHITSIQACFPLCQPKHSLFLIIIPDYYSARPDLWPPYLHLWLGIFINKYEKCTSTTLTDGRTRHRFEAKKSSRC